MKVILTFLITSLMWIGAFFIYTEILPQEDIAVEQNADIDYSEDIVGKWIPIEDAEYKLEFSKYGIFKQYIELLGTEFAKEYPYQVNKDVVIITQNDDNIDFPISIYTNENGTFLEIRDITQLSGKYKKAAPKSKKAQPKSTTTQAKQKVEQQKVENPKTLEKNYAELICGYWEPVEGNTLHLEITKYGTAIQWDFHYDGSKYERRREQYNISGNKLSIGSYYKCTVNVFVENGVTYLEVFGNEKYAGKYRKRE